MRLITTIVGFAAMCLVVIACGSAQGTPAESGSAPPRVTQAAGTAVPSAAVASSQASYDPKAAFAPTGVLVNANGQLYVSDCNAARIYRLGSSGDLTIVAGSGPRGFSAGSTGDGGPAVAAQLQCPLDMRYDRNGNIVVVSHGSNRIRAIDPAGTISTVAGTGATETNQGSFGGDGGPATQAHMKEPTYIVFDAAGDLYLSDRDNQRIRMIDPNGVIKTVAGTGAPGFSGDGGPAIRAAVDDPAGLAIDPAGNVYFADSNNHRVRRIDAAGRITTLAGTGETGDSGDGGPASRATLNDPEALLIDSNGNLLVADPAADRIRLIDRKGIITAFAGTGRAGYSGDGGPGTGATFQAADSPFCMALGPDRSIYIADSGNHAVRVVNQAGLMSTFGVGL